MKMFVFGLALFIVACDQTPTCNQLPRYGEQIQLNENVIPYETTDKQEKFIWKCTSQGKEHVYYITTDHARNILAVWKKPDYGD